MKRRRSSDLIEEETEARIRAHRQTLRPSWNPVKSLTDLSLEIAHEYEDRFLVELVQNGYDAHPVESRDGQIHILLDESRGDHAVLYVANGGKPFTRQNFEALSNIARSSKPPGEGIGNKGLGFRSTLQICDWPEIYSLDPEGGGIEFDGYCFGFAHDEDLMEEALGQRLADNGLAAEPAGSLPLIDEVRTQNQAILGELLPQLRHCVLAWCARRGRTSHPSWLQRDGVLTKLRSAGCLDFVPLCEEKVIRWVDALELWPAEMPLTADSATLQITDDDLENGRQQEQKEREAKERERRSIRLDGRQFRAAPGHYHNLARVVRESLDHRFLTRAKRLRELLRFAPAPEKGKGTSGVRAGGTSYRGRARDALTEVQREAIGLIGEVLAFEWLNSNYPDTNADSWVSSYRNDVIGGHSGDDSLGYDFKVVQRSRTLLFEVKATRSDEFEFALGESELRAARAARKGCYRIIFIQNVLDSADRDLFVLPNPLEQDHRKKFQQVNEDVRLRFVLGEGP